MIHMELSMFKEQKINLNKLKKTLAVIFLTAFPEYAVDAFKLHATGYLLKPVSADDLRREVE